MKIEMENIGGILRSQITLKKGINLIKGENAGGKTSFVRGLEATLLPRKEVEKHPEILNMFENRGRVSIDEYNRYFTRNGKFACVGDPFDVSGEAIAAYNIGWQDNELFKKIVNHENLVPFFEKHSDIKVYDYVLRGLNAEKDEKDKLLEAFRKEVAALKKANEIKSTAEKRINQLEKGLGEVKKQITPELLRSNAETQQQLAPLRDERLQVERIHADRQARIKDLKGDIKSLEVSISEFSKQYNAFIQLHSDPDQELRDLDADIREYETKFSTLKTSRQLALNRIKQLMNEEGAMRETGICSLCGQPVTEEHIVNELQNHEKAAEGIRKEIVRVDQKKKEAKQAVDNLQREYNKFRETQRERQRQQEKTLANKKNELNAYIKGQKPKKGEKLDIDDWGITTLESHIEKLSEEIEKLESQLQTELVTLDRKRDKITREIGKTEDEIVRANEKIEQYESAGEKAEETLDDVNWLKKEIGWWQTGRGLLRSSIIKKFNDKIKEVVTDLKYEFRDILLNEHFQLLVTRVKDSNVKAIPVEVLSESERVTIAITMMLAGRAAYTPEFPLFVLDKLTIDYDDNRFNTLLNYLKKEIEYVLVTVPFEVPELTVEYS